MRREVFRAIRSCPFSGEIWAWYIKSLVSCLSPLYPRAFASVD